MHDRLSLVLLVLISLSGVLLGREWAKQGALSADPRLKCCCVEVNGNE